jgi:hypothetical protein
MLDFQSLLLSLPLFECPSYPVNLDGLFLYLAWPMIRFELE